MRELIIQEAKEWRGTTYHHQACVKGVGVDCVGLIAGVGMAIGVLKINHATWARYARYSRTPNPHMMDKAMREYLIPIEHGQELLGDIAWIQWREDLPMHLALLSHDNSGNRTLLHSAADFDGVVEHGFTDEWRARVHSWWRYPGVTE